MSRSLPSGRWSERTGIYKYRVMRQQQCWLRNCPKVQPAYGMGGVGGMWSEVVRGAGGELGMQGVDELAE